MLTKAAPASSLRAALLQAAPNVATSPATVESYRQIARRVGSALDDLVGRSNGVGVASLEIEHVRRYVEGRLQRGGSKRTLQNEMSRLRNMLREAGRADLADSEEIAAKALGLSGASRAYHHEIVSTQQYERARVDLLEAGDRGAAAAMALQRFLGMRPVQAANATTRILRRYRRDLDAGDWPVFYGQQRKAVPGVAEALPGHPGGLVDAAYNSIRMAGSITRNGDGALLHAAYGDPRPLSGSSALTSYKHRLRRRGVSPKALRDSFAKQLLEELRAAGWPEADVVEAVWRALGGAWNSVRARQARRLVRSLDQLE